MSCMNHRPNQPMGVIYPAPPMQPPCSACAAYCTQSKPVTATPYPAGEPMQENAFMLVNKVPYVIDNTQITYGSMISVSEGIYTRITKRNDVSCLNLAGTFDMTDGIITNSLLNSYLNDMIAQGYATLEGVLPVQKSGVRFKLSYHVEDATGGVVFTSTHDCTVSKNKFHWTDVHDYFVQSFMGIFITEIPQLDYQGIYNFVVDKLEAYVDIIDTKTHVINELNPYYAFMNNNTRIAMQHDTIAKETADDSILVASVNINQTFPFQSNLTTKVKLSFTAFTSNMIATGNTYDVYKNLIDPVEISIADILKKINDLTTELNTLKESVQSYEETTNTEIANINTKLDNLYPMTVAYAKNTELKTGVLTYLTIGELYQVVETYTTTDDTSTSLATDLAADVDAGKLVHIS